MRINPLEGSNKSTYIPTHPSPARHCYIKIKTKINIPNGLQCLPKAMIDYTSFIVPEDVTYISVPYGDLVNT